MRQVAAWMDEVVGAAAADDEDKLESTITRVHTEVTALTTRFPAPGLPA